MHVTIDNLQNGRIFQQKDGFADISIQGRLLEHTDDFAFPGNVYASLFRAYDGTRVMRDVPAQMAGDTYTLTLKNVPAGGAYTLLVKFSPDRDKDMEIGGDARYDLGVGDLWVIAGQSNGTGYARTPGQDVADARVSLLGIDGNWRHAQNPLTVGQGLGVNEGFRTGATPFIRFANNLAHELNYPIGLIQTAQGGSILAWWEKGHGLYQNMLRFIEAAGGDVKGILWYQGCSDAERQEDVDTYEARFEQFVSDVRQELNAPALPFYTVQLNQMIWRNDEIGNQMWGAVKEAQRQAALKTENVYVTPAHGLSLSDWVHNDTAAGQIIGDRLSWQALQNTYHKAYWGMAPDVDTITVTEKQAVLTFRNLYSWFAGYIDPNAHYFTFEDAQGEIETGVPCIAGVTVTVPLMRAPQGTCFASFAARTVMSGTLPFDRATGIPPLGFYRVQAERIEENADA